MRPDDIRTKEFVTGVRGYVREEVRAFLRGIAAQLAERDAKIKELEAHLAAAAGLDRRTLLRMAGDEVASVLAAADKAARQLTDAALEDAERTTQRAGERARTEAHSLVADAEARAGKLLADAQARAAELVREAKHAARQRERQSRDATLALYRTMNELVPPLLTVRSQLEEFLAEVGVESAVDGDEDDAGASAGQGTHPPAIGGASAPVNDTPGPGTAARIDGDAVAVVRLDERQDEQRDEHASMLQQFDEIEPGAAES